MYVESGIQQQEKRPLALGVLGGEGREPKVGGREGERAVDWSGAK